VTADRPLGERVQWGPVQPPARTTLEGSHVSLRPLRSTDADPLYAVSHPPLADTGIWTYLPHGPFEDADQMRRDLELREHSLDPLYFTVLRAPESDPSGVAAYLRITPEHGVIEIGHIWFGAPLQRTTAATETIYLLARHAFDDLSYRRLEWKCDALNEPSKRAADRFGFRYEGTFRKHQVVKGRNRDTAWFAITDDEWPTIRQGFEAWLDPENFDADGRQRSSLHSMTCRSLQS
jgi:RimJ/RimL family protein N-acetyltransferase